MRFNKIARVLLSLIGLSTFYAKKGFATELALQEGALRKRIDQAATVVGDNAVLSNRRLEHNNNKSRKIAADERHLQYEEEYFQYEEESLQYEEEWFQNILLRSSENSFSLTPAPTTIISPTAAPISRTPTASPTRSLGPTEQAMTTSPSPKPTLKPTPGPTVSPSTSPTRTPTSTPTVAPTTGPTTSPTNEPTGQPTTLAPTAKCLIETEITCQTSDGIDCALVQGEQVPQCNCAECPSQVMFRYTGLSCPDVSIPGLVACMDEGPLPVRRAFVVVSTGQTELFSGSIAKDQEIQISQNGECLPSQVMIMISDISDTSISRQVLTLDTSCSAPGISLLEDFGAVQFSGYKCTGENVSHNCFADALFNITATNTGVVNLNVTTFDFTVNGATTNLLTNISAAELQLLPSDSLNIRESKVLERCRATQYIVTSTLIGNGGDCTATAELMIGPFEPGTPLPTTAPVAPTASPSAVPMTPSPTTVSITPSAVPGTSPPTTPPIPPTPSPSVVVTTPAPTSAPVIPTSMPSLISGTPSPTKTSVALTNAPSKAQPTSTPGPTMKCYFNITTNCTPPEGSDSCQQIRTAPELCQGQPTQLQFMYDGGGCDNSFNAQSPPLFVCEDYKGGPPTANGTPSFVVVTDIRGAGIVYFADWVDVGGIFTVRDNGSLLEPNLNITIYDSNITVPDSIIQTMVFHDSCSQSSQSLFLKDRFGSMQLVGFRNAVQGEISSFVNASFDISIAVPANSAGQPITIRSITTSFSEAPGGQEALVNSTEEYNGQLISSDNSSILLGNLPLDIDLTVRRTYNVFTTVTGVGSDGQGCEGNDLYQFAAGQPPPPLFPTFAPTQSPTVSSQPTPNPETTPCDLKALLTCDVITGGSNTCVGLRNPSDVTCTGDLFPSSLSFQYTGNRCPVNPQNYECSDTNANLGAAKESVFVEISSGGKTIYSSQVGLNQVFTADGDYGANTTITLYAVQNGVRGEELQQLMIPTSCAPEKDLTLLNQYGALELTGFTNAALGEQSIEAQIALIYAVENLGYRTAQVQSALVIDAFAGGPIEIVDHPFPLGPGKQTVLFRNEQILNLRLKEQLGRVDTFFLSVRGTSISNTIACTDTAQLSF